MSVSVLGVDVDIVSYAEALANIDAWARQGGSYYVCAANVHMVMEARDSEQFSNVVNAADLVVPDGMPLAWWARAQGVAAVGRMRGPELMLRVCEHASTNRLTIGLYGGNEETLSRLRTELHARWPDLVIGYAYSPPFRPLDENEDQAVVVDIQKAGVEILFVGLGCPKQETWMADHKGRISTVMIGVGAAFDFHSGTLNEAPTWMQNSGLEWLYRLLSEPKRLWKRYFWHNTRFICLAARQLLRERITGERT